MGVETFLPVGLNSVLVPLRTEGELKGSHFLTEGHSARSPSHVPDHTEERKEEKGKERKKERGRQKKARSEERVDRVSQGLYIRSGLLSHPAVL